MMASTVGSQGDYLCVVSVAAGLLPAGVIRCGGLWQLLDSVDVRRLSGTTRRQTLVEKDSAANWRRRSNSKVDRGL